MLDVSTRLTLLALSRTAEDMCAIAFAQIKLEPVTVKVERNAFWSKVGGKHILELVRRDVPRSVSERAVRSCLISSNGAKGTHTSKYWKAIQYSASGRLSSVSKMKKSSQVISPRRARSATLKSIPNWARLIRVRSSRGAMALTNDSWSRYLCPHLRRFSEAPQQAR